MKILGQVVLFKLACEGVWAYVFEETKDFGPCEIACRDSSEDRAAEKLRLYVKLRKSGKIKEFEELSLEEMREME